MYGDRIFEGPSSLVNQVFYFISLYFHVVKESNKTTQN